MLEVYNLCIFTNHFPIRVHILFKKTERVHIYV